MSRLISRLSRVPIRLVGVCAVLCIVPLALLAYFSVRMSGQAVSKEVRARLSTTAAASAVSIEQEMEGLAELVDSYAERPVLIEALTARGKRGYDSRTIESQLSELRSTREHIDVVFVTDAKGTLIDIFPKTPSMIGENFAFRDWYRGAVETGAPYVSEAYRSAAAGRPRVVAASAPVLAPDKAGRQGAHSAIIVATYGLDALRDVTRSFASAQGVDLSVTDQRGALLAGPGSVRSQLISRRSDPRVAPALEGRSGIVRTRGPEGAVLSAYAPVPDIGWTVSASVPVPAALGGVSTLRSAVLSTASFLGLILLGGVSLLVLTLREHIRVERDLEESEKRTRSILEAAEDAYVAMDEEGLITDWNRQAEAIFGWTRKEALGQTVASTIVPPDHRAAHKEGLRRFLETGEGPVLNKRIEIDAQHREGHLLPVELAVWAVEHDGSHSFNALVNDISERKRIQRELFEAHEKALEASKLKSQFLANMSHEIRTPINGVIGMLGLLLDTDLGNEQQEYAESARRSAEALLVVINDILDFSKIEAGKMDLESIDFELRTVVEEVAAMLGEQAYSKGLELAALIHPEVPTAVRGDPHRVRQVLVNLVGNAVKFTEEGEIVIIVMVEDAEVDVPTFRFEVSDTGIGLSDEDSKHLFESFSQADASTTRRHGGTGLGLAICKQLAELMGGEIGLRSKLGEGSTFWFTARLEKGSETARSLPVEEESLAGLRVLVVDDHATNRTIVEQNLLSWGMSPACAENGKQALDVLRAAAADGEPYPLALLDFHMPAMDGIELATEIKQDPALDRTRLVLLTSLSERGNMEAAQRAGFQGYLTKPVTKTSLLDCIATVMGMREVEDWTRLVTRQSLAEARAQDRARLLVAEDNIVNQKVAVKTLEKLGYRVDVASNGLEAVDAVASTGYAAVLMDCQMPQMDGYDATRAIRGLEGEASKTPIIAMTAAAMKEDEEKALAAGMDAYVAKPVKQDVLAAVLQRWIRHGNAVDAPAEAETEPEDGVLDDATIGRLRELDDDVGGMAELAELFITDAQKNIETLRRAVAGGDAETARGAAHSLKGSAGNFGAHKLSQMCGIVEQGAAKGELSAVSEHLEGIQAEFDRVTEALRAAFASPAPSKA